MNGCMESEMTGLNFAYVVKYVWANKLYIVECSIGYFPVQGERQTEHTAKHATKHITSTVGVACVAGRSFRVSLGTKFKA